MRVPATIKKALMHVPRIKFYVEARQFRDHWSRFCPPGHFYSPIPSDDEVERWNKRRLPVGNGNGLELRMEAQLALVQELARHYDEIPFKERSESHLRY